MKLLLALGVVAAVGAACPAQEITFPPDARVVNVQTYGAIPGDGKDDTAALRKAIAENIGTDGRYSRPRILYLPSGVYDLSAPLESRVGTTGWGLGWRAGLVLIGQSREKTVLRLRDNTPAFSNPAKPLALLKTGSEYAQDSKPKESGGGNQAFRHEICNLTLDTGKGNSGAVGIDYVANNRGTIESVTIRSGDGTGVCGLLLTREWPGPALVKNVAIIGFDTGIGAAHYQYGMTFEHIRLENQNKVGVANSTNALWFRALTSKNRVPAVRSSGEAGQIVLINAKLGGGTPGMMALEGKAQFFVRGATFDGYAGLLDGQTGNEIAVPRTQRVGTGNAVSLNLTVEETPEFHSNNAADWANVEAFGAKADDGNDDSEAIQKAIDSGKAIVYLPNGQYHIAKTLVLRGSLHKFVGMQASLSGVKGVTLSPMLRFEGKAVTILERLRLGRIEHAGKGTLVIRHCDIGGYQNTPDGTGKLFIEDVIGKPYQILYPQKVWMRQVNTEFGDAPHLENRGGQVWILGWKTEGQLTVLQNDGGSVEVLGGLFYPLRKVPTNLPLFVNNNGRLSASYVENGSTPYTIHLRDTQNGKTQELTRKELGGRGTPLLRAGTL